MHYKSYLWIHLESVCMCVLLNSCSLTWNKNENLWDWGLVYFAVLLLALLCCDVRLLLRWICIALDCSILDSLEWLSIQHHAQCSPVVHGMHLVICRFSTCQCCGSGGSGAALTATHNLQFTNLGTYNNSKQRTERPTHALMNSLFNRQLQLQLLRLYCGWFFFALPEQLLSSVAAAAQVISRFPTIYNPLCHSAETERVLLNFKLGLLHSFAV